MLENFRRLFDAFTSDGAPSAAQSDSALQLAYAVLLVEVMRIDAKVSAAERDAVVDSLRRQFALSGVELERLLAVAEQTASNANDYFHFTSNLNDHFTQAQKLQLVEQMWQVAYADAKLDANESHLISKIAGLLYVPHGEYIGAKMRAKEAAGLL